MYKLNLNRCIIALSIGLAVVLAIAGCKVPSVVTPTAKLTVPGAYDKARDTTNMSAMPWRSFFKDQNLVDLIDTALKNNQ
jgi:outer membrane protein TolC